MKTLSIRCLVVRGLAAVAISFASSSALAVVTFSDDFDVDTSANWAVNKVGPATVINTATFAFDYSTLGIPTAPNSTGGSTRGLKLQANVFGSTGSVNVPGLSVSPLLASIPTGADFTLKADVWMNYQSPIIGPTTPSGSGTTQAGGIGALTNGTSPNVAGTVNGVFFASTLDGGSGSDYRAYAPAKTAGYVIADGVFAATSQNNTNVFYTTAFPGGASAPAAQVTLASPMAMSGTTPAGITAFQWRTWTIERAGGTMTWKIGSTLLATVPLSGAGTTSGNNILLSHFDTNATVSGDAISRELLFTLFDNVVVNAVPEPGAYLFGSVATAIVGMIAYRRRKSA